jgi:hypothetical protein
MANRWISRVACQPAMFQFNLRLLQVLFQLFQFRRVTVQESLHSSTGFAASLRKALIEQVAKMERKKS